MLLKNFFMNKRLQKVVHIVSAQVRVAVGGEHLVDVALSGRDEFEDRDIERADAEVVDRDAAALLFVQAVGQCGGSRLIHQTQNFETCDFARVFGGLALGVVKVGRHGDDRAVNGIAEESFGPIFQFAEDESGNLRRGKEFVPESDTDNVFTGWVDAEWEKLELVLHVPYSAAHEALDRVDGALRLGKQTPAGRLADDDASVRVEAHDRGQKGFAVRARNTVRLARLRIHVCDEAVGGAEIDSYDASHVLLSTFAQGRVQRPRLLQFLLDIVHQVSDIRAAVEQFVKPHHDCLSIGVRRAGIASGIPPSSARLELRVPRAERVVKILLGGFKTRLKGREIPAAYFRLAQLVERLVQLEDFLEQFRRGLLLLLTLFARSFDFEQVFDAGDGVA